jgi:hypothetical protein
MPLYQIGASELAGEFSVNILPITSLLNLISTSLKRQNNNLPPAPSKGEGDGRELAEKNEPHCLIDFFNKVMRLRYLLKLFATEVVLFSKIR